jgi:hypothetical protein
MDARRGGVGWGGGVILNCFRTKRLSSDEINSAQVSNNC